MTHLEKRMLVCSLREPIRFEVRLSCSRPFGFGYTIQYVSLGLTWLLLVIRIAVLEAQVRVSRLREVKNGEERLGVRR